MLQKETFPIDEDTNYPVDYHWRASENHTKRRKRENRERENIIFHFMNQITVLSYLVDRRTISELIFRMQI